MERRSFAISQILILAVAALAFAVVALHGITGYGGTKVIVAQFTEARRDADTIVAIDQVLDAVVNAETGQRGFLLTGNRKYLEPYRRGLQRVSIDLRSVDRLTAAEPDQQERLALLRRAISEKFADLARTIQAYDREGPRAATAILSSDDGIRTMATIRLTIRQMLNREEIERAAARAGAEASSESVLNGIVIATSVAGLLLILTVVQVVITGRARQRALEESESANRAKDQFLATVSHELRTPLTAILGWSAMLAEDPLDPEVLREGVAAIQNTASVQKKLIEDLLDVSRIHNGKLRLSMRTLDLTDAVRAAVDSMRPAADAKSIAIVANLEAGIRISGDPDRLQQIVWNLMTNAVKFTPRGGRIHVGISRLDSHVLIEIRDSGEGIDPAFLRHVFEPFQQSDSSRARVHKGLGLGLSIVKYLVEAHGGEVSVSSAGQGLGTTMRVRLPIMPIVHGEVPDQVTSSSFADGQPMTIGLPAVDALGGMSVLIVDDHGPTLDILSMILRKCGATVFAAGSAAEALTFFQMHRPDIIVSDIGMPVEDGLMLIDRIRQFPEDDGGRTPAIALTAYIRKEDSERLLAGGFQAYLTKPVEPAELVNAIARIGDGVRQRAHAITPTL